MIRKFVQNDVNDSIDNLKLELCQVMHKLYSEKILTDIGGNLSIRDPKDPHILWISPKGMQKNLVEPKHLIKLSLDEEVIEDLSGLGPSVEFPMHIAIAKKTNYTAILHSHGSYAVAYSLLKRPPIIPPLTAELSILIPYVVVIPYEPSGSKELGVAVTNALKKSDIIILQNNGVVVVAMTMKLAVQKTRALEDLLKVYTIAKQMGGEINPLPDA